MARNVSRARSSHRCKSIGFNQKVSSYSGIKFRSCLVDRTMLTLTKSIEARDRNIDPDFVVTLLVHDPLLLLELVIAGGEMPEGCFPLNSFATIGRSNPNKLAIFGASAPSVCTDHMSKVQV